MANVGDVFNAAGDAAKAVGDSVVAAGNAVNDTINETVRGAADVVSSAFGGDTRAQVQGRFDALHAKGQAKQEYERLARQQQGLQVSGNDPAAIREHDNWDSWSHQELYDFRRTLGIEMVQEASDGWHGIGEELSEVFAELDKEARAAAGDGMRGEAADAGMNATRPLQEWGTAFGDAVQMNALKMQEAGTSAEQTKASIQPPSEPSTARQIIVGGASGLTMGAAGAADAGLRMKEKDEDAKRARAVAKNVFTPGYDNVDTSTATLPPPRNPLNPPPPPPNRPSNDVSPSQDPGVSGRVAEPATPSTPAMPSVPSSSVDSGGVPVPPGGSVSGPSIPPSVPSPGGPPAGSESAWTKPTPPSVPVGPQPGVQPPPGGPPGGGGLMPGVAGTPPGMTGGSAGAGAARGLGAAGGAGAARGGATAPGAGGRAGAGAVGGARAGMSGAGSAGAAGARGGATGGAGAGAGRGGEGGGDEEHERPSWLEEPEDVFMNDMPKVAPPVFGA